MKDIEKKILGTCLGYPEQCDKVFETLKPEHFVEKQHQLIYKTIQDFNKSGKAFDIVLISMHLNEQNLIEAAGGISYITDLTSKVVYGDKLKEYVYIVLELFVKRSVQKIVFDISLSLNDSSNDIFDIIHEFNKKLEMLQENSTVSSYEIIEKIKDNVLTEMTKAVMEGKAEGIKTGIHRLNLNTNGWQKSDLIILAGRPGMGKTSAAIDFALTPALEGKKVLFFSLEMSSRQIVRRVQSIISNVDVQRVVNNSLSKDELREVVKYSDRLNGIPFYLDDTPAISVSELKRRAKKLQKESGLDLIIVDYLQLMKGDGQSREQEISEISRGLKAIAKELDVPVIALSQLSRKCEERADKKPMLSDLRESGAIEQDADMVIFCYRPEYYQINEYEIGGNVINTAGLFVLIVAKFRNGQTGEIKAGWKGSNTKLTDYQENAF